MIKPVVIYASVTTLASLLFGAALIYNGYQSLCLAIDAAFSGD